MLFTQIFLYYFPPTGIKRRVKRVFRVVLFICEAADTAIFLISRSGGNNEGWGRLVFASLWTSAHVCQHWEKYDDRLSCAGRARWKRHGGRAKIEKGIISFFYDFPLFCSISFTSHLPETHTYGPHELDRRAKVGTSHLLTRRHGKTALALFLSVSPSLNAKLPCWT